MRVLVFGLALVLGACSVGQYRDTSVPIQTVARVDLERYAGLWFEIARFPNPFERNCVGVTAEYALRADGRVSVRNACRRGTLDGPIDSAQGISRARDETGARLGVTFVPWLPVEGDYYILYLDADYTVAAVGAPAGRTGWILARDWAVDRAALEPALQALGDNGYDTRLLYWVPQPPGGRAGNG